MKERQRHYRTTIINTRCSLTPHLSSSRRTNTLKSSNNHVITLWLKTGRSQVTQIINEANKQIFCSSQKEHKRLNTLLRTSNANEGPTQTPHHRKTNEQKKAMFSYPPTEKRTRATVSNVNASYAIRSATPTKTSCIPLTTSCTSAKWACTYAVKKNFAATVIPAWKKHWNFYITLMLRLLSICMKQI